MSQRTPTHRRPSPGLSRGARALALGSASALCASLAVAVSAPPAQAAVSLTVSATGNDANPCTSGAPCKTVQRAVNAAGLFAEPQDVTIHVGAGTFAENATATSAVVINGSTVNPLSLTILGAGADKTTIKPAGPQRVFVIAGAYPVTLRGMTITGGAPAPAAEGASGAPGGGIARTGSGNLTLTDVAVLANSAGTGGKGVDGDAGTTLDNDGGNGTDGDPGGAGGVGGVGGGVAFLGTGDLTISGSTISGNKAGTGGDGGKGGQGGNGYTRIGTDGDGGAGAIGGAGGAGGSGGGVAFAGDTLEITNSTVVTNLTGRGGGGGAGGAGGQGGTSSSQGLGGNGGAGGAGGTGGAGGGIELLSGAVSATLTHLTLAANATHVGGPAGAGGAAGAGSTAGTAGGNGGPGLQHTSSGLHRTAGAITLGASLLSNSPANCSAVTGILATNSVAGDSSCFLAAPGLVVNAAAGNLAALAANGGTTPTAATTPGNPAIGAVPAAACAGTDQRGQTRPGLTAPQTCTAGAFEPQVPPVGPTITGAISSAHPKTKYGWYRDTVTVTFTCTPGSSPLTAPCPSPMVISTQGANQGGTVTVTNQQGLTSSIKVALNIDKGLPKIAIKGVKKGLTYNKAKKISCAATDSLSGPYVCQMKASGKLAQGNTLVRVNYKATAVDKAGNVSTKKGHYFFKSSALRAATSP